MTKKYTKEDFQELSSCPWCGAENYSQWGYKKDLVVFDTVKCNNCFLVYVRHRYSKIGLSKYYSNYINAVHQHDDVLNKQRDQMYTLEYELVKKYLKKKSDVLDVGCSGGYFLERFKAEGHDCYGVEFGEAAAKIAAKKFKVFCGEFPEISFDRKFDLIIFRGVIEHVFDPISYLNRTCELLNENGIVFITSTPNCDSLCCKVFKDFWNQHLPEEHLFHFSPKHFDKYFSSQCFIKLDEKYFYEETPYANIEDDLLAVAKAISDVRSKGMIEEKSPPFFGNMMSLLYKKDI